MEFKNKCLIERIKWIEDRKKYLENKLFEDLIDRENLKHFIKRSEFELQELDQQLKQLKDLLELHKKQEKEKDEKNETKNKR